MNRLLQEGGTVQYWVANTQWLFLRQPAPGCTVEELYAQVQTLEHKFYDFVGAVIISPPEYPYQLFNKSRFLFLQGNYAKIASPVTSKHKWSGMELLLDPVHHGKIFCHSILVKNSIHFIGFGLNYTGKHLH